MKDPDNYRGISLIPTIIKLLAKIVATKLAAMDIKYSLIAKEQAGFRYFEECVAQATTLYEIAKRRKIKNLQTWICFVDYSKAYDRVPHMALIHKLRSIGIGGKLLNVINGMYYDPKIAVRIGDDISGPSEHQFGVRQGCPASPILFDLYINDIFSRLLGVDVPGLPNRIPGLLFADNAVVLVDSAENLQTSLDTISAWSDAWEMAVNASKCAIMAISRDDAVEMTLQRQNIRKADNYTYLGYIMNSKWGVSDTIKNNKLKAQKALYSAYGFLNRSNVLTALKIKFINSALLPIGCCGGETFGMSEALFHPIQTVIHQGTRLVAKVGKSAAMERIREELGITSVFLRACIVRERAITKWPASKTWIADLINKPIKAQKSTWVTGSSRWKKRYCQTDAAGQTPKNKIQRELDWPTSIVPYTEAGPPGHREIENG
ncbi:RNA-directed DNA polymerase from mobile element jockey [Smittium culicis]|uniref:RNA-directed DNA polymerase from mobile element jockey n=1 Tax=Smittium culicis TaxID=133412 RepID=A0A1R1XMJ2_9FUNG|nr:RNA-directed DNA polymerase from mobile element jockey [Smittium culicis]